MSMSPNPFHSDTPGLAIDPATVTGIAHTDGLVTTWSMASQLPHAGYLPAELMRRLGNLHQRHPFEWIAVEHASMGTTRKRTAEFHGLLRGAIEIWAFQNGRIPVKRYMPTSIKKHLTGNGRATKQQMMAACRTLLGIAPKNDNEADAAALLSLALADRKAKQMQSQARRSQPRQRNL